MSDDFDATRHAIDRHVERCIALLREAASLPAGESRDVAVEKVRRLLDDASDLLAIFALERPVHDSEFEVRTRSIESLRALVARLAAVPPIT